MPAKRAAKPIGLAIVGAGRIGLIRAEIAAKHPNVGWIGLAEIRASRGNEVAERIRADFCTNDYRELLARPEVTAAVIATDNICTSIRFSRQSSADCLCSSKNPWRPSSQNRSGSCKRSKSPAWTRSSVIRNDSAGAGS